MVITCKFGGTSLATSENIRKCAEIVRADEDRKYVVVSAPGKKDKTTQKVTDLLYACHADRFDERAFDAHFSKIADTFREIASLVKEFPIEEELSAICLQIKFSESNLDFVLSRGEYLNAKIIAAYLGYEFLDASKFVRFKRGELDLEGTIEQAKRINEGGQVRDPGVLRHGRARSRKNLFAGRERHYGLDRRACIRV